MVIDLSAAIGRLDELHRLAHAASRLALAARWPAGLREATAGLAADLERLAGDLDRAADHAQAADLILDARDFLPRSFAEFGTAIADDLAREYRAAAGMALADAGDAAPKVPMVYGSRRGVAGRR